MNKTETNQIPNGWEETTWGDVATLGYGKSLNGYKGATGAVPVYGTNGHIGWCDKPLCNNSGIIVGRKGAYRGIHFSPVPFYVIDTAFFLKPKTSIDIKWAYWKLLTYDINSMDSGSAIPSTSRDEFYSLPVSIPPFSEQKAIARVLSSLDDKIELLRKQNETLEAIAQTIFKEGFVNFNFPDKNGRPYKDSGGKMIDSELGEIPDGWRVGKLGDEFGILMGQSPPGTSYNEESEGVVFFQGRTDFQERFPKVRLYTTEPKRIAEAFDVLVSVRAPVGDVNVAIETCCIGRGLSSVRGQQQSYTLYKMKFLGDVLRRFDAEGTVFGSIGKDDFKSIEVLIPTEEWINSFENTVNPLDQKILSNYKQIQTLTRLRDILLPKLMSGQVRVKGQ